MLLPFVDDSEEKGGLTEDQIKAFKNAQERYLKQSKLNGLK